MTQDDSRPAGEQSVTLRRSDVEGRIASLTGRHAALVVEAEQVAREIDVEKALLRYFPGGVVGGDDGGAAARPRTIREMLKAVMADAGVPVGIRQMIDAMQARFGATVARTSVSPILRKMLGRGEVEHVGDKWRLAEALET